MKTTKILAAAAALIASASVAQAASTTGSVSATVASSLTISQTSAMSFGTVAPGASGGTIDLFGNTISGTAKNISFTSQASGFTVSGAPLTNFTVTMPATINLTGPGNPMKVSFYLDPVTRVDAPEGATPFTGSFFGQTNASGTGLVGVYADLTIGAGQADGSYTGTYTITANY